MVCSLARRTFAVALCAMALGCSSSDEVTPEAVDAGIEDSGALDAPAEASTWQQGPIAVVEEPGSVWTVADRPHVDQTTVTVTAAGLVLTVEMTEGSLAEMVDSQYPSDEPFRWISSWSLVAEGLRLQAGGLYYLLVPKESCDVTVLGEGGTLLGSTHVDTDTSPFLDYFEDVRTIDILSHPLGALSVSTDAEVLQIQVPSYPDTTLFELDFDHSFKDRGQIDVHAELVLPLAP